jgi:conjugal transfer pilus assembly protein TraB
MLNKISDKYKAMGQTSKLLLIGGTVIVSFLVVGTMLSEKPRVNKKPIANVATDPRMSEVVPEQVAAEQHATSQRVRELEETVRVLTSKQNIVNPTVTGMSAGEAKQLQGQIDSLKAQLATNTSKGKPAGGSTTAGNAIDLNSPITTPVDGASNNPDGSPAEPKLSAIRVIKGERSATAAVKPIDNRPAIAYLPSGSNFEAVLMNGLDANTSVAANKTPSPSLLRIKTEAILPNLYSQDIKECFILVGSYGNLSSERAEMRTENISCVSETGKAFEGKAEGYVVGEDGKVGMRGRLVSKQGALLAKGFMAGFMGGLGQSFTAQPVQSLNVNPGTTQTYQYPEAGTALGNGVAGGLNRSAQMLSQFYIKMAEQMFPVIEIDAGRKVTVILLKGLEIK